MRKKSSNSAFNAPYLTGCSNQTIALVILCIVGCHRCVGYFFVVVVVVVNDPSVYYVLLSRNKVGHLLFSQSEISRWSIPVEQHFYSIILISPPPSVVLYSHVITESAGEICSIRSDVVDFLRRSVSWFSLVSTQSCWLTRTLTPVYIYRQAKASLHTNESIYKDHFGPMVLIIRTRTQWVDVVIIEGWLFIIKLEWNRWAISADHSTQQTDT